MSVPAEMWKRGNIVLLDGVGKRVSGNVRRRDWVDEGEFGLLVMRGEFKEGVSAAEGEERVFPLRVTKA